MPIDIDHGWCEHCERNTVFKRYVTNHGLHLGISIVTAGLWLIPWFIIWLCEDEFRCIECKRTAPRQKGGGARTVLIVLAVAVIAAALILAVSLFSRSGLWR